ncbi:alanine/glycine:cation symporter family protein [Boudabousia marimammalium]|uniref:Sodium:alanine symporter family protein n=1 Tax=Boudabousia marimammalium TaxID=156892 RepID=A0A1Q5PLZ2_9ACTO|nr:alanine/glycine:cation symporter family protein [Boudabousia marimammalium]OKL48060.1 sodium:alanine symporter family protein [Boudabousia marimammalium]
MEAFNTVLGHISDFMYTYMLVGLLMAAGIYFTIRTRGVQFRLFANMVSTIMKSRSVEGKGISSFQAFAIGIASRVGTGNIVGVAIALAVGGPGAIFWMWVVALLGMATAFIEATLAQMFKVRGSDGSFRGGPAYYIHRGLGSRTWGLVFAVLLIFTFGFAFNMVQANTIAGVFEASFGVPSWGTALILVALCAPIIMGGIRPVAKATEIIAPLMALIYVLIAIIIIGMNFSLIPAVFGAIFADAFGFWSAAGGLTGGFTAALLNGVKRGLFSNEAGMGSAPNAAATATVSHPVQQGLIQSMGVFVDTVVICSATAFICIVGGVYNVNQTDRDAAQTLTQDSIVNQLGGWTAIPVALIIFVFAYSSILGNYTYAEVNMDFIRGVGKPNYLLRALVVAAVALGSIWAFSTVWALADIAMGLMALVNLVAIFAMGGWAIAALRDYERQLPEVKSGTANDFSFVGVDNPDLPKDMVNAVWDEELGVTPS